MSTQTKAPNTTSPHAPDKPAGATPVLTAVGIEKSYRRFVWHARRSQPVLRGADLTLSGPIRNG